MKLVNEELINELKELSIKVSNGDLNFIVRCKAIKDIVDGRKEILSKKFIENDFYLNEDELKELNLISDYIKVKVEAEKVNTFIEYASDDAFWIKNTVKELKEFNFENLILQVVEKNKTLTLINDLVRVLISSDSEKIIEAHREELNITTIIELYEPLKQILVILYSGDTDKIATHITQIKNNHPKFITKSFTKKKIDEACSIYKRKLKTYMKENGIEDELNKEKKISDYMGEGFYVSDYGKDLLIPKGYVIENNKMYTLGENENRIPLFDTVMYINNVFFIVDEENGDSKYHVELNYLEDNVWKSIDVEKKTINNHREIINLSQYNLPINSDNAQIVARFLTKFESLNKTQLKGRELLIKSGWIGFDLLTRNGFFQNEGTDVEDLSKAKYHVSEKMVRSIPYSINTPQQFAIDREDGINYLFDFLINFNKFHDISINLPLMSFIMTSSIAPFIRKVTQNSGFPILNGSGAPGSGKTSIVNLLVEFLNIKNPLSYAIQITKFALQKDLTNINCVMSVHDEYKESDMELNYKMSIDGIYRGAYDGSTTEKGNVNKKNKYTGKIGVDEYTVEKGASVFGETSFTDQALKERSININFVSNKESRNVYFENLQRNLSELGEKKFYTYFIFEYLTNVLKNNNLKESFDECKKIMSPIIKEKINNNRVLENASVNLLGCFLYRGLFEYYNRSDEFFYTDEDFINLSLKVVSHVTDDKNTPLKTLIQRIANKHNQYKDSSSNFKVIDVDGKKGLFITNYFLKNFIGDLGRANNEIFRIDEKQFYQAVDKEKNSVENSILLLNPKEKSKGKIDFSFKTNITKNDGSPRGYVFDIERISNELDLPHNIWEVYDKNDFLKTFVAELNEKSSPIEEDFFDND